MQTSTAFVWRGNLARERVLLAHEPDFVPDPEHAETLLDPEEVDTDPVVDAVTDPETEETARDEI